jgi:hypothetical protein
LGDVDTLLADAGYFSAANVKACAEAGIDPLIAMGRKPHHQPLAERFAPAPPAPVDPTPVEAMAHRLRRPRAKKRSTLCASRRPNRCSASSSPCSDSANSHCAAWKTCVASGAS